MKKRILNWAIKKLLEQGDETDLLNVFKENISALIFKLYGTVSPIEHRALDIEMLAILFDAKYTEDTKALEIKLRPSEVLSNFYALANKGDGSFTLSPFYRVLAKKKDKEVLSLKYRLKISQ